MSQPSINHCRSCNYTFSDGRGVNGNRFCSERCQEWCDNGNPLYGQSTDKGPPYRVIAGPPDIRIGSIYYNDKLGIAGTQNDKRKPSPNITIEQLLDCLEIHSKHLKNGYIEGKEGRVKVRPDNRNFWLELDSSTRQLSAYKTKLRFMYNDDDKNKFFMYRLPSKTQAEAIRAAIGVRKKHSFTPETIAKVKNNLPTPLETP